MIEYLSYNPDIRQITCAALALTQKERQAENSDRVAVASITMVFPEFRKIAAPLQILISVAHKIDQIADQDGSCWLSHDPRSNITLFNLYYSELLKKYPLSRPFSRNLLNSLIGFIGQAATVEKESHSWKNPSESEIKTYRELINAIWTRMAVSIGTQILYPTENHFDPICQSNTASDFTYEAIIDKYKSFIADVDAKTPDADRSYQLYLWTMAAQNWFDHVKLDQNLAHGLPTFKRQHTEYETELIEKGCSPFITNTLRILTIAFLNIKRISCGKNIRI